MTISSTLSASDSWIPPNQNSTCLLTVTNSGSTAVNVTLPPSVQPSPGMTAGTVTPQPPNQVQIAANGGTLQYVWQVRVFPELPPNGQPITFQCSASVITDDGQSSSAGPINIVSTPYPNFAPWQYGSLRGDVNRLSALFVAVCH